MPPSGVITLAWSDNSPNEDGFRIERCSGSSCTSFLQIAQVGAKATSFQDPNRRSGRWYRYRVRAFNAQDSGYSNIASAKAP
jgi:tripartite motif-containing protein 71